MDKAPHPGEPISLEQIRLAQGLPPAKRSYTAISLEDALRNLQLRFNEEIRELTFASTPGAVERALLCRDVICLLAKAEGVMRSAAGG